MREYLESLRNWGRWGLGTDGLLGTLNLITPRHVSGAAQLVSQGVAVGCGLPVVYESTSPPSDTIAFTPGRLERGLHYMLEQSPANSEAADRHPIRIGVFDGFVLEPHGRVITHLDAPAHTALDGVIFNNVPFAEAVSADGAELGSIELVSSGIVGRGVLLDVAEMRGVQSLDDRDVIYPEDLEACEKWAGIRVGSGDCLLVRTGYRGRTLMGPPKGPGYARPGLQASCLPWLRARDVALLGSDTPNDCYPFGYILGLPIHTVGMWAIGLWLLDNCFLEALSVQCKSEERYEFMFAIAPLVLNRATCSPVNPLAVF